MPVRTATGFCFCQTDQAVSGLLAGSEAVGSPANPRVSAIMRISIEAAEGRLPQLIEAAAQGEDVVLSKADRPVARIVPITTAPFRIGILPGEAFGRGPDWLEPMPEDERALWEGGS